MQSRRNSVTSIFKVWILVQSFCRRLIFFQPADGRAQFNSRGLWRGGGPLPQTHRWIGEVDRSPPPFALGDLIPPPGSRMWHCYLELELEPWIFLSGTGTEAEKFGKDNLKPKPIDIFGFGHHCERFNREINLNKFSNLPHVKNKNNPILYEFFTC